MLAALEAWTNPDWAFLWNCLVGVITIVIVCVFFPFWDKVLKTGNILWAGEIF